MSSLLVAKTLKRLGLWGFLAFVGWATMACPGDPCAGGRCPSAETSCLPDGSCLPPDASSEAPHDPATPEAKTEPPESSKPPEQRPDPTEERPPDTTATDKTPEAPPPSCLRAGEDCTSRACCDGLLCDPQKRCTLPSSGEVTVKKDEFLYQVQASSPELLLWTQPVVQKAEPTALPPATQGDLIRVYAAKNEFEPFQILLRAPAARTLTLRWSMFPTLGAKQRLTMALAGYVKGKAEILTPLQQAQTIALAPGSTSALWGTLYVPEDATAGDHETTVTLTEGSKTWSVTIRLHVFNFALPREVHFHTQLNLTVAALKDGKGTDQEQVDRVKSFLIEHRMTPKSVPWPSGFSYGITWDNPQNPQRCKAFWDEPTEAPPYSIRHLARRYGKGEGWNDGVGFPTMMLFQFVDNSTPRPATFCTIPRGSGHDGTLAYNDAYGAYLKGLETYLIAEGLIDKGYYYVMNEPQDQADHTLAAHLCRLIRKAAPRLKIAVSEEAKPAIFADPKGACGYDIWIAHIPAYAPTFETAWQRHLQKGEKTWWYSLDHDAEPFLNPTLPERDGFHVRLLTWLAWKYRAEGWAYYNMDGFLSKGQPTVRWALMREAFEDYEYLWLANQGKRPTPKADAIPDASVSRLVSSLTSYSRDPAAVTKLRLELGRYLAKERTDLPLIQSEEPTRPKQAYFINFQDPKGEPKASPLQVDGKEYIKVGWDKYDAARGYGWFGPYLDRPDIVKTQWLTGTPASLTPLQRSILYDDYGRKNTFEFDLPNGLYTVTVSVGWHNKTYLYHQVWLEGSVLIDNEKTDASNNFYIVRSLEVDVKDGKLTLEMGGLSPKSNDFEYTMLNFLTIVPKP